ncbi:MAG TPA: hypothetical protein VGN00_08990 [Puia sp.]|jgi:hypothetical protein
MNNNPFLRRWGMPLLMAVLSLSGLLSALLGDHPGQVLSWIALSVPLVVVAWYAFRES